MDNKSWVVFYLSDPDLSDDVKTFLIGLAFKVVENGSTGAKFRKEDELNCKGEIHKSVPENSAEEFFFKATVIYREKVIYVSFSLPREVANFCPRVDSMWTNFTSEQCACARNAALS